MNTIYVLAPRAVFDAEFSKFQNKEGYYYSVRFNNQGAIRYSLDGNWVLLEEEEKAFRAEDLAREDVVVMTQQETKQFLIDNKENWTEEEEIYP